MPTSSIMKDFITTDREKFEMLKKELDEQTPPLSVPQQERKDPLARGRKLYKQFFVRGQRVKMSKIMEEIIAEEHICLFQANRVKGKDD